MGTETIKLFIICLNMCGLGIKRPLVGTETKISLFNVPSIVLGIKRPLVGTETICQILIFRLPELLLGIKRPLVGTETLYFFLHLFFLDN